MTKITEHESDDVLYKSNTIRHNDGRPVQTGLHALRTLPRSPICETPTEGDEVLPVSGSGPVTKNHITHKDPLRRGKKTRTGGKIRPQDIEH